nr:hypothetical protein B0A51_05986 [Rachicladosporium sp. CCFEE 5018]
MAFRFASPQRSFSLNQMGRIGDPDAFCLKPCKHHPVTPQYPTGNAAKAFNDLGQVVAAVAKGVSRLEFPRRQHRYSSVYVLMISWEYDDLGTREEIARLGKVFRSMYNYETHHFQIPCVDDPHYDLERELIRVKLDHGRTPGSLLIIYYGGHGEATNGSRNCIWKAWQSRPEGAPDLPTSPEVDWTKYQDRVMDAKADVLFILDCCYAGSTVHGFHAGRRELLLASGAHQTASNDNTFTQALINELIDLQGHECTALVLHSIMVQNAPKNRLDPSPMFMTTGNVPVAQTWIDWFRDHAPPEVAGVDFGLAIRPEAAYVSDSCLLLASVPVAVWNAMSLDPAIVFLSIIRSENVLSCDVPRSPEAMDLKHALSIAPPRPTPENETELQDPSRLTPSDATTAAVEQNAPHEIPMIPISRRFSTDRAAQVGRLSLTAPVEVMVRLRRKLILCCDGTWPDLRRMRLWPSSDATSGHQTNVKRIAQLISHEDDEHASQLVYYQSGMAQGGLLERLRPLDLMDSVRDAYMFLVNNYADGDRRDQEDSIFLVGASLGACVARIISGFAGTFGLLNKVAMPYFDDIFFDWQNARHSNPPSRFRDNYPGFEDHRKTRGWPSKSWKYSDADLGNRYLESYCRELEALGLTRQVKIQCIGVWDSAVPVNFASSSWSTAFPFVPNVSSPQEYIWQDSIIGNHVKHAFHALALDESQLRPVLWERPLENKTSLTQTWFPGTHHDVIGPSDGDAADISLMWMLDHLAGNSQEFDDARDALNWIKFDDPLVVLQTDLHRRMRAKASAPLGWGLSTLHRDPGVGKRTPGTGEALDKLKIVKQHLPYTNESVHMSVKFRENAHGASAEPDWRFAFPKGLDVRPWFWWLKNMLWHQPTTYEPSRQGQPLQYYHYKAAPGFIRFLPVAIGFGPGGSARSVSENMVLVPMK